MEKSFFVEGISYIKGTILDRLPAKARKPVEELITEMEDLIINARAPRFGLIGRRGAGKSSLINAIFGEYVAEVGSTQSQTGRGEWRLYKNERGEIEILDTRGIGEGTAPAEAHEQGSALEALKREIEQKCPDVLLFLVKAKEVDARIDDDLNEVEDLTKYIYDKYDYRIPLVGLVTQVDELDPVDVASPPFDDPDKKVNIEKVRDLLDKKISKRFGKSIALVLPLCSYMRFSKEEIAADRRWNIDVLIEHLVEKLPKGTHMVLARLARMVALQKKLARRLGKATAGLCATIATIPIPVGDIYPITSLQITMISAIACIGGRKMSARTVSEFFAAIGLSGTMGLTLKMFLRQVIKFIPFPPIGSAAAATVAYTGTMALCEAAIAYFIDKEGADEVRSIYTDAKACVDENAISE